MAEQKNSVYLRSLGCNKNTVDSEIILTLLKKRGHKVTEDPVEASSIIINTCAFIDEAKEEAIETICELSRQRKPGARSSGRFDFLVPGLGNRATNGKIWLFRKESGKVNV